MYFTFGGLELCDLCISKPEEESKVDELKVYTGKETLQALLEGKTLEYNGTLYRFTDKLQVDFKTGCGWESSMSITNNMLGYKMTEVVLPQVGDWVKVNKFANTYVGQIKRITGEGYHSHWDSDKEEKILVIDSESSWQILSLEQIAEYKREQAFAKVGRKLNEFREGDIVMIDSLGVTAIVVSKKNFLKVQLHGINQVGKGHIAQPHQLTPIAFAESQVDLS